MTRALKTEQNTNYVNDEIKFLFYRTDILQKGNMDEDYFEQEFEDELDALNELEMEGIDSALCKLYTFHLLTMF